MLFAIDTSTLILLQKLGWLSLCDEEAYDFIWPARVTQELKRQKSKNKAVLDLLNSGRAKEGTIQRSVEIKDISKTDAEVISLAAENNATVISEDVLLRKKAEKLKVSAISLASFSALLYQAGLSSKDEYLSRLKTLHEKTALSKSEYHQYLQGLLP